MSLNKETLIVHDNFEILGVLKELYFAKQKTKNKNFLLL